LIPEIITGFDEGATLERKVGELLKRQQKTLCTAESLTGGKIASTLVSVAGSSTYFKGGFITYSAETKINMLGVSAETIKRHTVVSKQVAEEMAILARKKIDTDFAISVTGNAGPTTDHNDKSVGLVYIALATKTTVFCKEFNFGQPREKVINRTVTKALEILQKEIIKNS